MPNIIARSVQALAGPIIQTLGTINPAIERQVLQETLQHPFNNGIVRATAQDLDYLLKQANQASWFTVKGFEGRGNFRLVQMLPKPGNSIDLEAMAKTPWSQLEPSLLKTPHLMIRPHLTSGSMASGVTLTTHRATSSRLYENARNHIRLTHAEGSPNLPTTAGIERNGIYFGNAGLLPLKSPLVDKLIRQYAGKDTVFEHYLRQFT